MKEFLLENKSFLIKGFEIMAAVVGLLYYNKYKNTAAKYFIFILIYLALLELIGAYTIYVEKYEFLKPVKDILKGTYFERNIWWYNLFWGIGGVLIFSFYYQKILKNNTFKKLLKWSTLIFVLISFMVIMYNGTKLFTHSFSIINVIGSLVIVQCSFYYFTEILQSDRVLAFYKSINFYISSSILLFWLMSTPLIFFSKYYTLQDVAYVNLRNLIILGAIGFMYTTFAIGLMVSKPEYDA